MRQIPFYDFFCLHRKFILLNFLLRNLKLKYRRSVFGYFWTLLIPLSQVAIYYFVYRVVLKVDVPNYLSFIVSGILPWVFFTSSVNESMDSLVNGYLLLNHAPVPIQVFPLASTLTNFINFVPSISLILLISWLDTGVAPGLEAILIIPLCLAFFVFTYSLSFLLACTYVYLRDLKYLISIGIQLWMYLTPILYRAEMVPERYRLILYLNPLAGFFSVLRKLLFNQSLPNLGELSSFLITTVLLLLFGEFIRARYARRLVEDL